MALSRARAAAVLGTLLLLAPAALLPQGLRQLYLQALEAIERSDWEAAEELLGAALELRSEEAGRLARRGIFQPYLPHFYLGVARTGQGDCRGALAAWRTSESQGAIAGLAEGGRLGEYRSYCERRLERLESIVADGARTLVATEAVAERLDDPELEPVMSARPAEGLPLAHRRTEAQALLTEARAELEAAWEGEDPDDAEAARELVAAASESVEGVHWAALRALADVRERAAASARRIEELRGLAGRLEQRLRAGGLPPGVESRRQEIESLLIATRSLEPTVTARQLDGLERRLTELQGRLEAAPAGPPGALRAAAAAWLRGDYREVTERLEAIPYQDPKSRAHCLLLRAAAHHALHALGEEPPGLARARADLRELRAALPELAPTAAAFSPEFLRLYALTGGAGE